MNARSTCSTLLAALALVACAASARAELPAAPAPFAAPAVAPAAPAPGVAPLAPEVAPSLSLAAADPEAPAPLVGSSGPAEPARVPLAKHWWFWAGLGTAAVAVVLVAIFVGPKDPYSGNATPGTVAIF